jgi:hypothetical protein
MKGLTLTSRERDLARVVINRVKHADPDTWDNPDSAIREAINLLYL